MKHTNVQKLTLAGLFCAIAVVGSMFSFPMFGSKCAPIQHMINVLCAVLLGPWYGLGAAFAASLIRNLLGLGSLMAFPGSMVGALLCGLAYHKTRSLLLDPHVSIAEAAEKSGYPDPNYFSRRFRFHHGLSPREYRADPRRYGGSDMA